MNYNLKEELEYAIKAFEAFKSYMQESCKTDLIKLNEDVPMHFLLTCSYKYREEKVCDPDIKLIDLKIRYFGFQRLNDNFSFQLNYEDYICKDDASCIDLNKVIKWLSGRLDFLKDLRFFDEDPAKLYYESLCELQPPNWEEFKAKSKVYRKNLRLHKLKSLDNKLVY